MCSAAGMDMNPQAREMADESMVRNLAAQAAAIWPQELPIVRGHALPAAPRILDVGCGTGEITSRLAEELPAARVVGVDIIDEHLALARRRYAAVGDRLTFQHGDAFALPFDDGAFDLVVCRHMLQAVPQPERVLGELARVARPGGALHLVVEDYDMIHAAPTRIDVSEFWHGATRAYGEATGCDLHIGRDAYQHLRRLGLADIRYHYVAVDTVRVPRDMFAAIFEAWRDGYVDNIAHYWRRTPAEVRDYFQATIDCIRDPAGFALWLVPVVTAKKP